MRHTFVYSILATGFACAPGASPEVCAFDALSVPAGARSAHVVDADSLGKAPFAAALDGGLLTLQPGYDDVGEHRLELSRGDCTGEAVVTVRAPTWRQITQWDPNDGPPGREYGAMWVDDDDPDQLFVLAGFHYRPEQFTPSNDMWAFDLVNETWRLVETTGDVPSEMAGFSIAPAGEGAVFLTGGIADNGLRADVYLVNYDEEPVRFTRTPARVGAVYQTAFVYDGPRDRHVFACGSSAVGPTCNVSTMAPDGTFTTLSPPGPAGRSGAFYSHDLENERLIVFAGDLGSTAGCNCAQDTWSLDLATLTWSEIPTEGNIGRRNGAHIYDPDGQRMIVFGGTNDGATTFPGLYALDLRAGDETWTLVEPEGQPPPPRSSGVAIYDAPRSRMVVGFGNGVGGVFTDLWALDL